MLYSCKFVESQDADWPSAPGYWQIKQNMWPTCGISFYWIAQVTHLMTAGISKKGMFTSKRFPATWRHVLCSTLVHLLLLRLTVNLAHLGKSQSSTQPKKYKCLRFITATWKTFWLQVLHPSSHLMLKYPIWKITSKKTSSMLTIGIHEKWLLFVTRKELLLLFMSTGDLLVNSTSCECPLECTTVSYEVQVFSSTFPSKTYNTTASFKKFMLSSERRLDGAADNFEKTIRWGTVTLL